VAVINPDRKRLAPPFDDLVRTAHDPFGRQREVDFDAQACAVEVVQDVQEPELAVARQTIRHEILGPDRVRRIGHRHLFRLLPLQPPARLDPEVQFKLPVDAVDTLVIPATSLDMARYRKQRPKPHVFVTLTSPSNRSAILSLSALR
jgi:hypothetical protein